MKVLSLCTLLALNQVESLSPAQIENTIRGLQSGLSYLDQNALNDPNSYQSKAMTAAKDTLSDSSKLQAFIADPDNAKNARFDYEEKHIKNFYAAACIFYATNGVPNEKTDEDEVIDSWDIVTNWITSPDYCKWYGLTCYLDTLNADQVQDQLADEKIVEIQLYNNTLYGTWPTEVGLLGDSLATIDLYDNFHHHAKDYSWFQSMEKMEYLFFGTTSWEADGIPEELNQLTELKQLDCSYSYWSEGPIRGSAFKDLTDLGYLDMGDNIYGVGEEIPPDLQRLPNLIRFYFDNVRFINAEREDVTFDMDFLTNMDAVIEAWFDFTKFSGGIPELPPSIKSFSCIFCGLTGNLDNLVKPNVDLDRAWLTGNDLTGTIPENIGTVNADMTLLYLEGNNFTSTKIPSSLCAQTTDADNKLLQQLGADENVCSDPESCCTCVGFDCGNTPDPTPAPTVAPEVPFGICFSGNSLVNVENRGNVKIADVVIGDKVLVGDNQYEPIYSFGHKNEVASAEYIRIATDATKKPLEVSAAHMVNIDGGRSVPASTINKGDMLQMLSGEFAAVKSIKKVTREGVYAPFTKSGKIVVNDIVASNYIAYQGSEYLKIGDIETPLSYQWIAHTFNSVHRLAVMMGFKGETYTSEGVSHWVDMPHRMFQWVLEQNMFIASALISSSLVFFTFASVLEFVLSTPLLLGAIFGMCTVVAYKKIGSKSA